MRNLLSFPYQEEDWGILGPRASGSNLPPSPPLESLALTKTDREQVEHLQRQLKNAKAQRTLADAQIEEAGRHLAALQEKYAKGR